MAAFWMMTDDSRLVSGSRLLAVFHARAPCRIA